MSPPVQGRRRDDPTPGRIPWRLARTVQRNPVLAGMTLALAVASLALVLVLNAQKDIQESRASGTRVSCEAQNALARTANEQTRLYENLIVTGARGSIIFEPLFARLHAPPYRVRLAQAIRSAQSVENLLLPILDCNRLADLVRDNVVIRVAPQIPPQPKTAPPPGLRVRNTPPPRGVRPRSPRRLKHG